MQQSFHTFTLKKSTGVFINNNTAELKGTPKPNRKSRVLTPVLIRIVGTRGKSLAVFLKLANSFVNNLGQPSLKEPTNIMVVEP